MKQLFIPLLTIAGRRIEKRRFTMPPVYIGGCGRSGTTLLLSILSAHNKIFACPRELNLFEKSEFTETGIVAPKFYRLYRTFLQNRIQSSADRYCEKSPANIRYIPQIDRFHQGNFKLIHIVRDGRDVILSKHPRGKREYWVEPLRWIEDVTAGLAYSGHPAIHLVKYEDLVTDYEQTIGSICHFLEIPLSQELLSWHKHATVRENNALFKTIGEINTASIGKWKRAENKERTEQLTHDLRAVELLKKLGYL